MVSALLSWASTRAARHPGSIRRSHLAFTQHGIGPSRRQRRQLVLLTHSRKANAIGRSSKTVREFLERNYKEDMDREATIRLAIKSLLEVVQTGAKNIEIAIMAPDKTIEMLPVEEIENHVKTIEQEKQEEAAKKKTGRSAGAGSTSLPTRSQDEA